MSDNNVCPICGAERNTAGLIVHAANCPNITTTNWTSPIHYIFPNTITIDEREYHFLQSEISRLKAELKNGQELLAYAMAEGERLKAAIEQANIERDEARRWARKYYQLYLIERQNYLDTFLDGDEWDEV